MTSEINSGSSNPIEHYVTEFEEVSKKSVTEEQKEEVRPSSPEPLPEWKVREREKEARRALAQLELKKAVEAQDMKAFAAVYAQRKDDIYFGLLIPVYAKAAHQTPITFVREIEKFLVEQDKSNLKYMLGEMDDLKGMQMLVTSPLIKEKHIRGALNEYFQEAAIHGEVYEGGRKGELPHRLELAQILIDHGANPFDTEYNSAWGVALSNKDINGLMMMMNHPDFNPEMEKLRYISGIFFYKFEEKFKVAEFWGEESEAGIREAKSDCKVFETLGLVPSSNETRLLIEKELELPFRQRKCLAAIMLPFINEEGVELSMETKTQLAMDFFRYYPHVGIFNCFIYQKVVEPAAIALLESGFDPKIIAQRVITDAFKSEISIPDLPKASEDATDDEEQEIYEKGVDISNYCSGLITKGYGYHLLVQNANIRTELLKLEGGQEQINKIEAFHGTLLETFGVPPWEGIDDIPNFGLKIYHLAKENFSKEPISH
ncbi:MAG: hypothetical protein H7A41_06575 [Chlamydiales bacterium]|nr:hypothetical protein [Chlamydiales bacterium]